MQSQVPLEELQSRLSRFKERMNLTQPEWRLGVIFSKINIFYFTGTLQDGMLFIPRDEDAVFWVRRSYERAKYESLFSVIKPMNSFKDAAVETKNLPSAIYLETEFVPLAMLQRFQKYFPFAEVKSLDSQVGWTRSIKSPYELNLMEKAGKIHIRVLEERAPSLLREGMSEIELATDLYSVMMAEGHHGLSRFGMFDTEMVLGHISFGESALYPTSFNGPGGNLGPSPAIPFPGSPDRKLKKGDLVFLDAGCGVDGYHTDKTLTYMFGAKLPDDVIAKHNECVSIQNRIAAMLKPGTIPSEIYTKIMESLKPGFIKDFMGFGNRQVKFLGHGIGLTISETPMIAQGFDEPLQEGMVFAIEPKKGIEGVGMVGIENTFFVTPEGGRCITGNNPGLIPVNI